MLAALLLLSCGDWLEESGRLSGECQAHSPYCVLVQPRKKPIFCLVKIPDIPFSTYTCLCPGLGLQIR